MAGQHSQHEALPTRLLLTAAAASAAETVTYPIDMVKTQLQLQTRLGADAAAPHHHHHHPAPRTAASSLRAAPLGAVGTARALVQRQGLAGLYTGLSPAILRHLVYTCARITVYEELRSALLAQQQQQQQQQQRPTAPAPRSGHGTDAAASGTLPLAGKLLLGLTAGAVGQLLAVPADLLKVRMQADARAMQLGQLQRRRYASVGDAAAAVWRESGLTGMWRGGLPAVQRAALVNLGELATYDQAKASVLSSGWVGEGVLAHTAASACSGLVASLVSTPADVVKTRLMAQQRHDAAASGSGSASSGSSGSSGSSSGRATARGGAAVQYRGALDCLVKTVRADGLLGLYKGFFPTWARLGPWQLVFWVSYEELRRAAHLAAF